MREAQYDKDAIASLKLIMAAEKIYRMEAGIYLPAADVSSINQNLRLSLVTGTNRLWDYKAEVDNASDPQTCCLQAIRTTAVGGSASKKWVLRQDTPDNAPISGNCP